MADTVVAPITGEMLWFEAENRIGPDDFAAAIDALTAANRSEPDGVREGRIARLRRLAAEHPAPGDGRPVWPPPYDDPFPGTTTLPEVPVADLTAELLGGCLLHHGALLVRGLFSTPDVEGLVDATDQALDAAQQYRASGLTANTAPWYVPNNQQTHLVFGQGTEWVSVSESPRAMYRVTEAFRPVGRGVIADYLGEHPLMAADKWTLRRIQPDTIGDWHQDGNFLGGDIRVVNVWVALSRCGGDVPSHGLQVAPRRLPILESGTHGARLPIAIGDPIIEEAMGGVATADPTYEAGDALFFDQLTAHRTGSKPGNDRQRYAIESWFFAPSTYPPGFGTALLF